jgi:prepilin-type N-terminal cleavage/methylation domain-containing protein
MEIMTGSKHTCGFTLIEILIVVGVIAILASTVLVVALRMENQSDERLLANVCGLLKASLREYYDFTGGFPQQPDRTYDPDPAVTAVAVSAHAQLMYDALDMVPASRESLKGIDGSLIRAPGGGSATPTIQDPWGTTLNYIYAPADQFPELVSAGPDKRFGTADDISSRGK